MSVSPENTAETRLSSPGNDPAIGWGLWVFSAVLCLMFVGMLHDFRFSGASRAELYENIMNGAGAADRDSSSIPVERKAAFVLSGVLALYCLATRRRGVTLESMPLALLLGSVIGLIFCSILWSESPRSTALELVRIAVFSTLVYGMAIRFTPLELTKIIMLASAMSVAVACLSELKGIGPAHNEGPFRLAGSLHSNNLARFATFSVVGALAMLHLRGKGSLRYAALLVVSLVALYLTRSRTSLFCCLVGVFAFYVVNMSWRQRAMYGAMGSLLLGGLLLGSGVTGWGGAEDAGKVANMGRADDSGSLNGRLPLWDELWGMADGHYLQGFGYGGFWNERRNVQLYHALDWVPGHSHNICFETMLHIGIIGVCLVVSAALLATYRLGKIAARDHAVGYQALFAMLASILAASFTTSSFILPREFAVVTGTLIFSALFTPAWRQVKQREAPAVLGGGVVWSKRLGAT